jgi:hypothetical protein
MRESAKAKALTMREVWSSALSVASITILSAAITQVAVLHNNGLGGAVGQYCFMLPPSDKNGKSRGSATPNPKP